jgi:predicted unusual protein kinase regulating ubiquinone biosynthesis (AarF/ABC1/UbiB family)
MLWWNDRIYFLDLGMVGEVGPEVRELMLLLLMAFWQGDATFLAEVVLMLAGDEQGRELDLEAYERELGELLLRYRQASLKDIQLGPILQGITEISARHGARVPASLALSGKAFAQMQLATAELDPSLDPFSVAGPFLRRTLAGRLRERADPQRVLYDVERLRVRLTRLAEAIERISGARPGARLQVDLGGTERLEQAIHVAGRRLALAITAGGALVGTAFTAAAAEVDGWVPATLGGAGAVLTAGLAYDLVRRGRR